MQKLIPWKEKMKGWNETITTSENGPKELNFKEKFQGSWSCNIGIVMRMN
jgi:hypothetical protein